MGKVAAAEMKKNKKKGRPSLLDLRLRNLKQQEQEQEQHQQTLIASNPNFNSPSRRSTRRNPNLNGNSPPSDWITGDFGDDDEDDERKEKKVKLVVRLPPSNQHYPRAKSSENSLSLNSASYGSDSNADAEKPKINASSNRSGDLADADQAEKVQKATDTQHGSPLESGPTTPLPDKKLLVFILDRLQKKDTYGVFSEPVDPNELPDYHEIINHPMDFGTVRKKLDEGRYSSLDEFEADVFLICSNAMQYNAPDTIYFRQARSIQELARRDFENLRQVNDDGEPQPKIVRRGRPPSKNLKKPLGSPPLERVGPESSSDATLASGGDNANGSNTYNLRRGPMSFKSQSNDAFFKAFHQSRNNETYNDWLTEWNSEFPASVLKAEAKYGKKLFSFDENRRATYKQFHPSAFGHEPSALTTLNGDMRQLMGVGVHSEHGYARSLARFAADLGPVVWKIASKKIECVLPTGVKFGPGWVGENEASLMPPSALAEQRSLNNMIEGSHPLGPVTTPLSAINSVVAHRPAFPNKGDKVEAVGGRNSISELAVLKSGIAGTSTGHFFQTGQKHMLHPNRNGFNGVVDYDRSSQTDLRARLAMQAGQSRRLEEASVPTQILSRSNPLISPSMAANHTSSEPKLPVSSSSTLYENISASGTRADSCTAPEVAVSSGVVQPWQGLPPQHRQYSLPVPPDLNVGVQATSSPSSSSCIGSPQQPDLALQL